jgi:hypothetical protein
MIAAAAVSPSCAFVVIKARALAHGAAVRDLRHADVVIGDPAPPNLSGYAPTH